MSLECIQTKGEGGSAWPEESLSVSLEGSAANRTAVDSELSAVGSLSCDNECSWTMIDLREYWSEGCCCVELSSRDNFKC